MSGRIHEAKPLAALGKPLLGREEDSEPLAGDVVQRAEIDDTTRGQREEELPRLFYLGGVEPSRKDDLVVGSHRDLEHRQSSLL